MDFLPLSDFFESAGNAKISHDEESKFVALAYYLPIHAVKVYVKNYTTTCSSLIQDPVLGSVKQSF